MKPLMKSLFGLGPFVSFWVIREIADVVGEAAALSWGIADTALRWLSEDDQAPRPDAEGAEEEE